MTEEALTVQGGPDEPAVATTDEPRLGRPDQPAPAADAGDTPAPEREVGPVVAPDEAPAPALPEVVPDRRLSFAGVEVVLPDTNPVMILQEAEVPYRELRIPIGAAEGVAIAYAWRGIATPRPLTHELFADVLRAFGVTLEVVRITDVRGSSFSAELSFNGRPGPRTVPCRPSDGIALALRQPLAVPIMAAPAVMDSASTRPR